MTKIYELAGKDRCQIFTRYCGVKVTIEFRATGGVNRRSQYKTSDRFVQDALEHDFRFGKLYTCIQTFDESKPEEVTAAVEEPSRAKKINTVRDANSAIIYFNRKGENPKTDEDITELMARYNVAFPNWDRSKGAE